MNQQLSPRNYASKSLKPSVQDMDIAHRVQYRREVESISPSTLGYSSEPSLGQAKIYDP